LKHWQVILRDLVKKYGITIKKTQTSHSKYNRARPIANMAGQNRLFFDDRINVEKLRSLFINMFTFILKMK